MWLSLLLTVLVPILLQHSVAEEMDLVDYDMLAMVHLFETGTDSEKVEISQHIMEVCEATPEKREAFISDGIVTISLDLVETGSDTQQLTSANLLAFFSSDRAAHVVIAKKLGLCVELLSRKSPISQLSAMVLVNLMMDLDVIEEIAETGAIPAMMSPLLSMIKRGTDEEKRMAASALRNLARNDHCREILGKNSFAVQALLILLVEGNLVQKTIIAGAMANMCIYPPNRQILGKKVDWEVITNLVEIDDPTGQVLKIAGYSNKVAGAKALNRLSLEHEANKVRMVEAGAMSPLSRMILIGSPDEKEVAMAALWGLFDNNFTEGQEEILDLGTIPTLLRVVEDAITKTVLKEFALATLLAMCKFSTRSAIRQSLIGNNAVPILLKITQAEQSNTMKELALSLLYSLITEPQGESSLLAVNGIPVLLSMIKNNADDRASAIGILARFSEPKSVAQLVAAKIEPLLLELMQIGTVFHKFYACLLISSLSANRFSQKRTIRGLPTLVGLMDLSATHESMIPKLWAGRIETMLMLLPDLFTPDDCAQRLRRSAAMAVFQLAEHSQTNRDKIMESGALPALIAMLKSQDEDLVTTLWALDLLIDSDDVIEEVADGGGIDALLTLMKEKSRQMNEKEQATRVLRKLWLNGVMNSVQEQKYRKLMKGLQTEL
eukprot:Lithocolla_globosa_v1_NODE_1962_length_2237_cov_4.914299.p1 type:complete len:665 gc:universal NODE_1962_length_2237_cov_4.914299:125-2119(+)